MRRRTFGAAVIVAAPATTGLAACGTDPSITKAAGDGTLKGGIDLKPFVDASVPVR